MVSSLMISIGLVLCLVCSEWGASSSSSSTPFSSLSSSTPAFLRHNANIFGIGRGGGLFGGKNGDGNKESTGDAMAAAAAANGVGTKYPPMTNEEVEDWLSHIPVFAITDSSGACVVLKRNDTSVIDFFLAPHTANVTMQFLQESSQGMDLRISAFSLGKIWSRFLASGGQAETANVTRVQGAGQDGESENQTAVTSVTYRLVPDPRDLLGARMLLTMDPADGEKAKNGQPLTAADAQAAVEKAMKESPKFMGENEIPVFMIPHMRMQRQAQPSEDEETSEQLQLLPMYFSLMDMMSTWQQLGAQNAAGGGMEPAINLMELHELVEKMQEESEIDFRKTIVLMPPNPVTPGGGASSSLGGGGASTLAGATTTAQDPMGGGNTLGDL